VAADAGEVDIVHRRPPDAPVVDREAARLDDVQRRRHAGGQADESAEILGNIRLVERKAHGFFSPLVGLPASAPRKPPCDRLSQLGIVPACDQPQP
jgi:hypothetical protein